MLYAAWPQFQREVDQGIAVLDSGERGRIHAWVARFEPWGPLVIVTLMTAQMFLMVVPSPAVIAVAVVAYGALWGSLIALAAVLTASTVGYWIGRALGPATIDRLIGPRSAGQVADYVGRYGAWTIVVFRLSPVLSNDAISFAAGIVRMGYWTFIAATAAGILPLIGAIAVVGHQSGGITRTLLWVSLLSLGALAAYVLWDRLWRRRPG
jgi:uncharacterized membrane protein YdjX (TVP38/TMEM64 family)